MLQEPIEECAFKAQSKPRVERKARSLGPRPGARVRARGSGQGLRAMNVHVFFTSTSVSPPPAPCSSRGESISSKMWVCRSFLPSRASCLELKNRELALIKRERPRGRQQPGGWLRHPKICRWRCRRGQAKRGKSRQLGWERGQVLAYRGQARQGKSRQLGWERR